MDIKLSNFYRPPWCCIHICSPVTHRLRYNKTSSNSLVLSETLVSCNNVAANVQFSSFWGHISRLGPCDHAKAVC